MNQQPSIKKLVPHKRKIVTLIAEELIETGYLQPGMSFPLVIKPAIKGLSLSVWASNNRELIDAQLRGHGAILFRGFNVSTVLEFKQFTDAISGQLLEYTYRSTPRTHLSENIYTSTEYPANQFIPLHNEMSYARNWPMKIWFCCLQVAAQGGETPIADSSKVFDRIDPRIRELFMKRGVMYVRNYGEGVDLSWQQVFGTTSKAVVEDYCRQVGMEFEWKGSNRLRTRQKCQAVATHPVTGKMVWFNQAHLFHVTSLGQEICKSMLEEFTEEELPRNAFFGDGSSIEASILDEIREAYSQEEVVFPWQEHDILMLDNMLMAHGRTPYAGPRRVVVGMAEPSGSQNTEHRSS